MTDPVDTDALRDLGAALAADGHSFGKRMLAAADELDRLREELRQIASHPLLFAYTRDSVEAYGATMSAMRWTHEELDGTKRDRDRLRAVIENAPHRERCRPHSACTCWKADAL